MTETERAAVVQLTKAATFEEREELIDLLEANGYDAEINFIGGEIVLSRPERD